jgi:ATP-dependent Clp protease ATP-binding subunit ClpX
MNKTENNKCSFCGKEIENICISGNNANICDECISLGYKIINENKTEIHNHSMKDVPKPKEIKEYLDQYVIGQEIAKERLCVAVYNHYKRISSSSTNDVEIDKSNIILCGPTGSGKSYLARTIAKFIDVPFAVADATSLTESGYVGDDVESILSRLLQVCDYDVEKAERGIVFIDEIDKIARKGDNPSITRDVSGEGVQQGLLKLLEGSVVLCPPNGGRKHPEQKMIPVDTKNILFICAGAFVGLDKKISQRYNQRAVGFDAITKRMDKIEEDNILSKVTPIDLKSFGLIPEIIGRLPVLTYMEPLNKEALLKILKEPKNALVKQYQKLFEIDGIELKFEDDALEYIVEKTSEYNLGARGLRGIMEDVMTKAMFEMPSEDIRELIIDLDYVKEKLDKK